MKRKHTEVNNRWGTIRSSDKVFASVDISRVIPPGHFQSRAVSLRRILLVLVLCGAQITQGAEPSSAGDRRSTALRELAPLPKFQTKIDHSYQYPAGFSFNGEPLDHRRVEPPRERIADLQKRLGRDADKTTLWLRIRDAQLYLGDTNGAMEAEQAAEKWLRSQIVIDPKNGRLHTQLAMTVLPSRPAETTSLLREGVQLSPDDSLCWIQLAWHLAQDCQAQLNQITDLSAVALPPQDLVREQRRRAEAALARMTPEARRTLRAQFQEARAAFESATRSAASSPEAHVGRWLFESSVAPALEAALIDPSGWNSVTDAMRAFSPQALQTVRVAVRHATNEPFAVLYVAMLVTSASLGDRRDELMVHDALPLLPAKDREFIEDCFAKLRTAAASEDPSIQRGARLSMAAFQMVVRANPNGAVEDALAAARLLPNCKVGWDLALGCMGLAGWTTNALPLADEALSHLDLPSLRLHRGRIRMQLGQLAGAEADLRAALAKDSEDPTISLALAGILLRRGEAADLVAAGSLLDKIRDGTAPQRALEPDLSLSRAIHLGLTRRIPEGKRVLRQLLAQMPTEPRIFRALEVFRE